MTDDLGSVSAAVAFEEKGSPWLNAYALAGAAFIAVPTTQQDPQVPDDI